MNRPALNINASVSASCPAISVLPVHVIPPVTVRDEPPPTRAGRKRQNVTLGRLPRLTRGLAVSARRERAAASAAVAQYGIKTGRLDAPIASLSGGNQQKAILARALLTEPRVLLLDDPTRGVDVGAKADLYRLIDRLCRDGMGVVMTSSELPELLLLCDRILVLREGRLTAEFRRSDGFSEQSIMEAATRGLAEER